MYFSKIGAVMAMAINVIISYNWLFSMGNKHIQ